ncbi:MAG TPA: glycosyl hydrolase, partial [Ktedonobacterales bacterium]
MIKLYIGLDGALAAVTHRGEGWTADVRTLGDNASHTPADPRVSSDPYCLAVDPQRPELVYCGTFSDGMWRSRDAGVTWEPASDGITQPAIQSVAVSATERVNGHGVVFAGTEPSALFRSEDAGATWRELSALRRLPSAPTWSFPPRPYTSHVRWITPDPLVPGRIFVAIEAGALVRSLDGGETWEDRTPESPYDTHTLLMHRLAPDRLYS